MIYMNLLYKWTYCNECLPTVYINKDYVQEDGEWDHEKDVIY